MCKKDSKWKLAGAFDKFKEAYEPYLDSLSFESGDYQIVIPEEPKDLIREGNEMFHCVGQYIDKVANGKTLIVFVRKKANPNKCYITCEVSPKSGKIGQYFLAHDCHISKREDIDFKKEYQDHLSLAWIINHLNNNDN